MEYRRLGRSGLQLSAVSLGAWTTIGEKLDLAESQRLLSAAYDLGVNFFDNAEVYANGESEEAPRRVPLGTCHNLPTRTLTGNAA